MKRYCRPKPLTNEYEMIIYRFKIGDAVEITTMPCPKIGWSRLYVPATITTVEDGLITVEFKDGHQETVESRCLTKEQEETYYRHKPLAISVTATAKKIREDQTLLKEFHAERAALIAIYVQRQAMISATVGIIGTAMALIKSANMACGVTDEIAIKISYFIMLDTLIGGYPDDWCLSAEKLPDKERGEER